MSIAEMADDCEKRQRRVTRTVRRHFTIKPFISRAVPDGAFRSRFSSHTRCPVREWDDYGRRSSLRPTLHPNVGGVFSSRVVSLRFSTWPPQTVRFPQRYTVHWLGGRFEARRTRLEASFRVPSASCGFRVPSGRGRLEAERRESSEQTSDWTTPAAGRPP